MTANLVLWIVLAHFIGDYGFQSHWMAVNKTSRFWPAAIHALTYTIPYAVVLLVFTPNLGVITALGIIGGTHYYIDRYRLAKHVGWLKNQIGPKDSRPTWPEAKANGGYNKETPVWLANFLMFVTDNTMHLIINAFSVYYVLAFPSIVEWLVSL